MYIRKCTKAAACHQTSFIYLNVATLLLMGRVMNFFDCMHVLIFGRSSKRLWKAESFGKSLRQPGFMRQCWSSNSYIGKSHAVTWNKQRESSSQYKKFSMGYLFVDLNSSYTKVQIGQGRICPLIYSNVCTCTGTFISPI